MQFLVYLIVVTLADEDTYSKFVYIIADVNVGVVERLGDSLVTADCFATTCQKHFCSLVTDRNCMVLQLVYF